MDFRVLDHPGPPLALLLVLAALFGFAGCGDDAAAGEPLGIEEWREQVAPLCSDGVQEAVALPLPQSTAELSADAAARSEIVVTVREGILPLGLPDEQGEAAMRYVSELGADAKLLDRIAAKAEAGEDVGRLFGRLDESSGQLAVELGLDDCAALSNAIARTP